MPHSNMTRGMAATIRRLAFFAGLFHDIGKLTQFFQSKLRSTKVLRDEISHEWVSAWVLSHMLQHQSLHWDGWLAAWQAWEDNGIQYLLSSHRSHQPWRPFERLNSFESAALMSVATHHRLFSADEAREDRDQRRNPPGSEVVSPHRNHVSGISPATTVTPWRRLGNCFQNEHETRRWQALLDEGRQLLQGDAQPSQQPAYWHKAGLIARAALILADHHVSAIRVKEPGGPSSHLQSGAYANSLRDDGKAILNQPLIWHLEQVGRMALSCVDFFGPQLLPALDADKRRAMRNTGGLQPSRFSWQDHACSFIERTRNRDAADSAFLIFNVASTGAGKTRANVRALQACRSSVDPLRITAGFNLRTLTLQTASAYRSELQLSDDECACVIGDPLARALHMYEEQDDSQAATPDAYASSGCDSEGFLKQLPIWVQGLDRPGQGHANATLLGAPVLVATMDYLVAAGDPTRQAQHVLALLRIAHSDLLIDEADSYDPQGLIAVLRVVQMAGMFGRNVVISSATLSSVLAEKIEQAWRSGIAMHCADGFEALTPHTLLISNQGSGTGRQLAHAGSDLPFRPWYEESMACLSAKTVAADIHRMGRIVQIDSQKDFPSIVAKSCLSAHKDHGWSCSSNGRLVHASVGIVRLANVEPLQRLANQLASQAWPEGIAVKICAYHASEIPARRYLKERALDLLLKRSGNPELSQHPLIAQEIASLPAHVRHLVLIVLASPVEEVGRDHDFDWAVVEPSSMHSIIQLAGRVNRHRLAPVSRPNVYLLDRNLRALQHQPLCFIRPGLQQSDAYGSPLTHAHDRLTCLLRPMASDAALALTFALDAGLIFDPVRRCQFAKEDEKAIELLLNATTGFFDEHNEQWACDWFYVNHPLREKDFSETWRAQPLPDGRLLLERYEPNHRGSPWVEQRNGDRETLAIHPAATWLSPSVHDAEQRLRRQLEAMYGPGAAQISESLQRARQFSMPGTDGSAYPVISWTGIRSSQAGNKHAARQRPS